MTLRLAPLLFAVLTLAACTPSETPPAAVATAPAAAESATPAPASAVAAVEATDNTPAPAATATPPTGPAPVAGVDYAEIPGGQPFSPVPGKIEVVEVFSYTCTHCAEFEPMVTAWRAKQTADVNFVPVAAPFGPNPVPYAKAYYAAETMGLVGKTHDPMFRAIHLDRTLPVAPVTDAQIASFYAKYGANAQQFASTMASFAVDAKTKRGLQFAQRSAVEGTPSLVIDGKYRITAKSLEDNLRIADHLIAQQRAANAVAAPAAPPAGG